MKRWSFVRVLGFGAVYAFGACATAICIDVARLRADQAAYKFAHGLADNAEVMLVGPAVQHRTNPLVRQQR